MRWSGSVSACFLTAGTKDWHPGRRCPLSDAPPKGPEVNRNAVLSGDFQPLTFIWSFSYLLWSGYFFRRPKKGVITKIRLLKKHFRREGKTKIKMFHKTLNYPIHSARFEIMSGKERAEQFCPFDSARINTRSTYSF